MLQHLLTRKIKWFSLSKNRNRSTSRPEELGLRVCVGSGIQIKLADSLALVGHSYSALLLYTHAEGIVVSVHTTTCLPI